MPDELNWKPWVYGLFAALVGGGAGAISSAGSQVILDPQHSNPVELLERMGISFVISGLIAVAFYLKQSPLPPLVHIESIEQKIKSLDGGGVVIETKKEISEQPKPTDGK